MIAWQRSRDGYSSGSTGVTVSASTDGAPRRAAPRRRSGGARAFDLVAARERLHLTALGLLIPEVDRAKSSLPQIGQVVESDSLTAPPYTADTRRVRRSRARLDPPILLHADDTRSTRKKVLCDTRRGNCVSPSAVGSGSTGTRSYSESRLGGGPSPRTSSPPSQATTRPVVAAALAREANCT